MNLKNQNDLYFGTERVQTFLFFSYISHSLVDTRRGDEPYNYNIRVTVMQNVKTWRTNSRKRQKSFFTTAPEKLCTKAKGAEQQALLALLPNGMFD